MLEPPSLPGVSLGERSPALRKFLARALHPGEAVIWQGRPAPGEAPRPWRVARGIGLFFVLCWLVGALALGGAGVTAQIRAGRLDGAVIFAALTLMMFCFAAGFWYMINRLGGIFTDRHYLLTTERALLIMPDAFRRYRAFTVTPHELARMQRTESKPDGSGTLVFSSPEDASSDNEFRPGFYEVPQVEMVERLIREMIARHGVRG